MTNDRAATEHAKQATSWAASTITKAGCTLHAVPGGWDIETPNNGWRAANSWQELCAIAREVSHLGD